MAIIIDTSGLYALCDAADKWHGAVVAYLADSREPVVAPATLLAEIDYLVADRLGVKAELAFLNSCLAGHPVLEPFGLDDLARTVEIIEQYSDLNIGVVDASIVALAERLGVSKILTLDRRHFRQFRPRHCDAFDLVPELRE